LATELRDSNPRVSALVEELKADGSIMVIVNEQTKDEVLFYNDAEFNVDVDESTCFLV
jgi:hypothetical protein